MITSRDTAVVAAAALSLLVAPGCEKRAEPIGQPAPPEAKSPAVPASPATNQQIKMEELKALLTKYGFRVRDVHVAGPKIALIFSELHQKDVRDLVKGSLVNAQRFVPNNLLCTEGSCNGIDSAENLSVMRSIQNILEKRPVDAPREPLPVSEFAANWKELEDNGYFKVRGMECDAALAIDSNLALRALGVFEGVSKQVGAGKEIALVEKGAHSTKPLQEAFAALEYLGARYPESPRLDLFKFVSADGKTIVSQSNLPALRSFLGSFSEWYKSEFFPRRNADAAAGIEAQMIANSVSICSAPVGMLHTVPKEYTGYDSLGDALAKRGISSLVIDFTGVSFEDMPRVEPKPAKVNGK
jgi:hypothetical protein